MSDLVVNFASSIKEFGVVFKSENGDIVNLKSFQVLMKRNLFKDIDTAFMFIKSTLFENMTKSSSNQSLMRKSVFRTIVSCLKDPEFNTYDLLVEKIEKLLPNLPELDHSFSVQGFVPAIYSDKLFSSPNHDAFEFCVVCSNFVDLMTWFLPFNLENAFYRNCNGLSKFVCEDWTLSPNGFTLKHIKPGTYAPFVWGEHFGAHVNNEWMEFSEKFKTIQTSYVFGFIKSPKDSEFQLITKIPAIKLENVQSNSFFNKPPSNDYIRELLKAGFYKPEYSESEIIILVRRSTEIAQIFANQNNSFGLPFLYWFPDFLELFDYSIRSPSKPLAAILNICKEFRPKYEQLLKQDKDGLQMFELYFEYQLKAIDILRTRLPDDIFGSNYDNDVDNMFYSLNKDLKKAHELTLAPLLRLRQLSGKMESEASHAGESTMKEFCLTVSSKNQESLLEQINKLKSTFPELTINPIQK